MLGIEPGAAISMLRSLSPKHHLGLCVVDRRRNVLGQHVDEAVEVSKEPLADQPQKWPNVHLHLLEGF